MATEIEAAKWMVYHASYLRTEGKPYTKEASMAKLFCAKMAREVTNLAMQIHGGYGYMKEYAVERMYRDAKKQRSTKEQARSRKLSSQNRLCKLRSNDL